MRRISYYNVFIEVSDFGILTNKPTFVLLADFIELGILVK